MAVQDVMLMHLHLHQLICQEEMAVLVVVVEQELHQQVEDLEQVIPLQQLLLKVLMVVKVLVHLKQVLVAEVEPVQLGLVEQQQLVNQVAQELHLQFHQRQSQEQVVVAVEQDIPEVLVLLVLVELVVVEQEMVAAQQ